MEAVRSFAAVFGDLEFLINDAARLRKVCGLFPVRSSLDDIYDGTEFESSMKPFETLTGFARPCYNITPGWVSQRTAWWSMLQKVFSGTDVETALSEYSDIVNSRGNNTKTNGAAGNGKSRVLFISSNAIDYPGVEEQIEGIREALGDDAFLHSNSDNAAEKLDAVLALFNTDIRTEAGDLHITISVGSADFPENASTIEELVQAADKALYYVKGNGRNAYRRYSDIDWR